MATPRVLREAVAHLPAHHEMSERRACLVIGTDRTTVWCQLRHAENAAVRVRMRRRGQLSRTENWRQRISQQTSLGDLILGHRSGPRVRVACLQPILPGGAEV